MEKKRRKSAKKIKDQVLTVRMNEEFKEKVETIASEKYGLNSGELVRYFLQRAIESPIHNFR